MNKALKGSILLLMLIVLNVKSAGAWEVTGTVTDDMKIPVNGALVTLKGSGYQTLTDLAGNFRIEGEEGGQFTLSINCLGCQPWDSLLNLNASSKLSIKVRLQTGHFEYPQVQVFDSKEQAMRNLPGAATLITPLQIKMVQPLQSNEVIRKIPGLHAVDEEGLSLRPNIGIRGLDPDRSRYIMVLEDGVPVSLSPYGESEMYYSPSIDRMQQVEVLKGSSSIQYGPRTIGGVLNYRTADPPSSTAGAVQLTGGEGGYASALVSVGTTKGNTGVLFNYLRKQTDDFGMLRLRLNDVNTKLRWMLSARQVLNLRIGVYDEVSNANYIGITQAMYDAGGNDFVRLAPDDRFHVRRYSASFTYNHTITDQLRLEALVFAYTTQRNWCRQDFTYNVVDTAGNLLAPPADFSGQVWGDESLSGGAIYMRNSTGNRNRRFDVGGAEVRLRYNISGELLEHSILTGVRFIAEKAHEIRVNGKYPGALSGEISDEEFRPLQGYSAFVSDQISLGQKWMFTPGIRLEAMHFEREIIRGKYTVNGVSQVRDTLIINETSLQQWIPGAGITWKPAKGIDVFGGAHLGFAPPRLKDAITSDGVDQQLDAEICWNYELGVRTVLLKKIQLDVTGFYLDFSNQVIPVSESSGRAGAGLVNGGATRSMGVESSLQFQHDRLFQTKCGAVVWMNMTWCQASFSSDRYQKGTEAIVNLNGNRLPYAPEWTGNVLLSIVSPVGLRFNVNMQYTGEQFTDVQNTVAAPANGLKGKLAAYQIFDIGSSWESKKLGLELNCSVKNIADARYIYTRRPQGIRVGLPRMIFVGVRKSFGKS